MCNCAIAHFVTHWTIAHFQRVTKSAIAQLLIFKERQKVWLHIRTFLKSDKKVWLHICTFKKSHRKGKLYNHSFEMSKCVKMCKKSANFKIALSSHCKKIAQLLFWKGQMWEKGNHTFSIIALFKVQISVILKLTLFCTFSHIHSIQKNDCAITVIWHFFK